MVLWILLLVRICSIHRRNNKIFQGTFVIKGLKISLAIMTRAQRIERLLPKVKLLCCCVVKFLFFILHPISVYLSYQMIPVFFIFWGTARPRNDFCLICNIYFLQSSTVIILTGDLASYLIFLMATRFHRFFLFRLPNHYYLRIWWRPVKALWFGARWSIMKTTTPLLSAEQPEDIGDSKER